MKAITQLFFISTIITSAQTNVVNIQYDQNYPVVISTNRNLAIYFQSDLVKNAAFKSMDFSVDRPIKFGFGSITNIIYSILILKPEWAYNISVKSEDGGLIDKTKEGLNYGTNFNKIKGFNEGAIDTSIGRPPYWYLADPINQGFFFSLHLPAPEKLFKFERPGRYVMSIESQCLFRHFPPTSTNYFLVKFPPVNLTIVKLNSTRQP